MAAVPAMANAAPGKTAGTHSPPPTPLPYGMSAITYHRMLAQIPLDAAATRIREAVARSGVGHDGFVEVWVDQDHNAITVYWHGPVPADIQRLFASLRSHMSVRVAPARYSRSQLDQAVHHVVHGKFTVPVVAAGPLPDGSAIQVTVSGLTPKTSGQQLFGTDTAVKVISASAPEGDQTCIWNSVDTLGPPARCNDIAPGYWGGAVIHNINNQELCSTGFGVHSTVDSRVYMLTAAHCGTVGNTFKNGQDAQTLGQMTHRSTNHDAAMIETSAGNAYYDGPGVFSGDTHNSKIVAGQQPSAINDLLCVSGAVAGVICGLQASCFNQTVTTGGFTAHNVALAAFTSGSQTIAGDSGGPVFSLAQNNKVTAKGIHKGLWPDCRTGVQDEMYMTIDWISQDFKVTVNTG